MADDAMKNPAIKLRLAIVRDLSEKFGGVHHPSDDPNRST
jgi:hypothetical protein